MTRLLGVVFAGAILSAQVGWETPQGSRPGKPGLISPVLKAAPIPEGTATRSPGRLPNTVDVLVSIEKDGRVKPAEVLRSMDRRKGGLDDQAKEIVKTWTFEPGTSKGKPARVAVVLSVDFGDGRALPPAMPLNVKLPSDFTDGLRYAHEPGVTPPVRRMGMTPPYTEALLDSHIQGDVEIATIIRADGHVGDMLILKTLGKLADMVAMAAVKEWFYSPALADGVPVATFAVVTVSFRLG